MSEIKEESLNVLKNEISLLQDQPPFGTAPFGWLKWIYEKSNNSLLLESLPLMSKEAVCREDIYKMVLNGRISTISCVTTILAWGGMRRNNAITALEKINFWLPICEEIRNGKLSRGEAYKKLITVRNQKQMGGMGPAFFTKLIFFLMHKQKNQGYIMDQWTGASVNLLTNREIVNLKKIKNQESYYEIVSDKNSEEDYENFCSFIEQIAEKIKENPIKVELAMFSNGGKFKGGWRKFVIKSRDAV